MDTQDTSAASNAAYENIMTRHSVRSYADKAVSDSIIEKLLRAGMAAPSCANRQPWEFVVVTDPAGKKILSEASQWAKSADKAPLVIVVCGNLDKAFEPAPSYWIQDCSAVSENILLAAHALGLGGVWCGIYPEQDRVIKVRKDLQLPENVIPLNLLCIGYPFAPGKVMEKWNPSVIHFSHY